MNPATRERLARTRAQADRIREHARAIPRTDAPLTPAEESLVDCVEQLAGLLVDLSICLGMS